jgi:hypothetical protein
VEEEIFWVGMGSEQGRNRNKNQLTSLIKNMSYGAKGRPEL